jgi:hypothetical protein
LPTLFYYQKELRKELGYDMVEEFMYYLDGKIKRTWNIKNDQEYHAIPVRKLR